MKIKFGLKIRLKDNTAFKDLMTETYALEIKKLRETGTWRFVAQEFCQMHPELHIIGGNQFEGRELCESARAFLGEPVEPDWN